MCLAPVPGHDEDADTIDDSCDGCPHIADPAQGDSDGDRVGDACDPDPAVGGLRPATRTIGGTLSSGLGVPVRYRLRVTDLAVRFTSLTVIRAE